MNLFGIQVPETIELFGVPLLINPVTLLIAAFPLIFALALFTYWLSQRSTPRAAYKHEYDFYDIGPVPTIENNAFFADDEQYQVAQSQSAQSQSAQSHGGRNDGQLLGTQPQTNFVDVEDEVTEPVKVPSFYKTAPAYLSYISGGNHLPKKLAVEGDAPIRIGRKKSMCELVLDDRRVSRLHSLITQLDGEFHIIDEGSAGGTFVNKKKLGSTNSYRLNHNDVINFNEVEYRFEITPKALGQG